MKNLQNRSLDNIIKMSIEESKQYKNKFLCYEIEENKITLTFFLNPYQSFSKHKAAATKKIKELWNKNLFFYNNLTLIEIDHNTNNLTKYIYKGF